MWIQAYTPHDLTVDEHALEQLKRCMEVGEAPAGVLCADHHVGYSQPIGGAIAYPNHISPSGVGYDIGCGNKAVATSLLYSDIRKDLPRIMDEVARRISFGIGRPNNEPVDHPVLDKIRTDAPIPQIKSLQGKAATQLGTVGAGNHYVDLFREEGTDRVWIGVHFGSRGFGHTIASGFLSLAQGLKFDDRPKEGEMDADPTLLHIDSPLGYMYIEAMNLAGEYAYAGRDVVCNTVLDILGKPGVFKEVHNHHNFAWREATDWGDAWVVRKGCTPLFPGQEGFVGGSMGENAVIIEGKGPIRPADAGDILGLQTGRAALNSAPHGAGRVMSRTEAAGKQKKRWYCRSCGWEQGFGVQAPKDDRCPSCKRVGNLNKHWVTLQEGKINWQVVQKEIARLGIELRGGAADEAPGAYKQLPDVLSAHQGYVEVTHTLRPIGVAMAGAGIKDPYKD